MKRFITSVALTLIVCLTCALGAQAANVSDGANVLTDTQTLSQMADEIYLQTGILVCFETIDGITTDAQMDEWMAQNCPNADCAYLLVWPDGGYYWLELVGAAEDAISDEQYSLIKQAYAAETTYQSGAEEYYRALAACLGAQLSEPPEGEGGLITAPVGGAFAPVERMCDLVVDEAQVLSEEELARLNAAAEDIAANYPYEVAVVFLSSLNGANVMDCADDVYDYNGFGYGANDDGILLLICPSEREYWISACGAGMEMFDSKRQQTLDSNTVTYLADEDWALAAECFLTGCRHYLGEGLPRYTVSPLWIAVDLAAGFLLAFIPIGVLKRKMKAVAPAKEASEWMSDVTLTQSRDIFLSHRQVRRRIETSSSSGGSHRSSSGLSHSGRGGRF